ncbi:hypothetical protein CEQ90_05540 [Lewinellaceae bacterium SD302]|nr:hypothetical protein CEQ90_05540 [Lewinellaceae bacterium SD302]
MSPGDSFHTQARNFTKTFNPANIVSGNGFFYFTYKKGASPSSVVEKESDVSIHNSWVDDVSFPGQSFQVQPPQFQAVSQAGKVIVGISNGKRTWLRGIEVLNPGNVETIQSVTAGFDQKIKAADKPFIILYKLK